MPIGALLGPDALADHVTVLHPRRHSDIARMRFGRRLF
jgi:hypothetical protein